MDTEITPWYRKPNSSWWNSGEPIHGVHMAPTWQVPSLFPLLPPHWHSGSRTRNYYKADDEGNLIDPEALLLTSHCHNLLISQAVKSHGSQAYNNATRPFAPMSTLRTDRCPFWFTESGLKEARIYLAQISLVIFWMNHMSRAACSERTLEKTSRVNVNEFRVAFYIYQEPRLRNLIRA